MPAYAIFIRNKTTNPEEMATYLERSKGTAKPFGSKALAFNGRIRVIEGDDAEGVVLIEFPSFENAEAWYSSEGYQGAKLHRHNGADYRAMIVQGL